MDEEDEKQDEEEEQDEFEPSAEDEWFWSSSP